MRLKIVEGGSVEEVVVKEVKRYREGLCFDAGTGSTHVMMFMDEQKTELVARLLQPLTKKDPAPVFTDIRSRD